MAGTAIDLFSGAGGVTTGLKRQGANVLAAVENDPIAARTFRLNHAEVDLVEDDIRNVSPFTLRRQLGLGKRELDLITACAPCQGFSSLGKRDSRDERNDLIFQVIAFVAEFEPEFVAFENVPHLKKDARFTAFLEQLRTLGYGIREAILNAADFHTPQRRKRLVLLAGRGRTDFEAPTLVPFSPSDDEVVSSNVRGAFARLSAIDSGDALHTTPNHPPKVLQRIQAIPKNGGSRRELPEHLWLDCHRVLKGAGNSYGRMTWEDVSPTLTTRCTTPACGRFIHPEEDRAITHREAASLQSFPIDYQFYGGRMAIAEQIGNAVPVTLARSVWSTCIPGT